MSRPNSTAVLIVALAIVVAALVVAFALPREGAPPVAATGARTAPPSSAATLVASPAASPAATAGSRTFTSSLGYTVQLPAAYRRSDLQSSAGPRPDGDPSDLGHDLYTSRDPASEADAMRRSDVGPGPAQTLTAHVGVRTNPGGLSATAYADSVKGAYGFFVVSIDPTTVDGHPAAKLNLRYARDDPKIFYELFITDGDRIWAVGYFPGVAGIEVPTGASDEAVRSITDSFRFAR